MLAPETLPVVVMLPPEMLPEMLAVPVTLAPVEVTVNTLAVPPTDVVTLPFRATTVLDVPLTTCVGVAGVTELYDTSLVVLL